MQLIINPFYNPNNYRLVFGELSLAHAVSEHKLEEAGDRSIHG